MAGMDGNVILLTSRGEEGTLTRNLFEDWQSFQAEDRKYGAGRVGAIGKIDQQMDIEVSRLSRPSMS
jgi:cleavage and polyadenylation specificity factor subunit 2